VTLRGGAGGSTAPNPYVGFGDFQPATNAQLARSFPPERCGEDARLAAGLGRLPGTRLEVETARQLAGASPNDVKMGRAFTGEALKGAHLDQYRVVHLATHALLPAELTCMQEPSILVSLSNNATDAASGFIPASEVLNIKLNADLVVLSACNTGGPGGAEGGEALSGLARAFFYAGARGLMVTHWQLDDSAGAFTVAETLRRQIRGASTAAALRGAQVALLDAAKSGDLPEDFAHPFYWAPFALIGDGRRAP
jgi:CHAT domain-containing protein